MSKQFAGVLAAIVLIFAGIILISSHKSSSSSTKENTATLTNHVEGSTSSGVKLVEYGDFQCPYCQLASAPVKAAVEKYKDQIQFQYRNYPLVNNHPNAFAAARAAEAAALQNKYWEMHDILYENNDPSGRSGWVAASDPTTYFVQFATAIGLNVTQYKTDFASSKVNDLIRADMAEGTKLNIQGTPSFFIDGKAVTIPNTEADYEKVIKTELAKKQPATPATTSSDSSAPAPTSSDSTTTPEPTTNGN